MQLLGCVQGTLSNKLLKTVFDACKDAVYVLLVTGKLLALTTDG